MALRKKEQQSKDKVKETPEMDAPRQPVKVTPKEGKASLGDGTVRVDH